MSSTIKEAFDLRDALADRLEAEIVSDARVTFSKGADPGDFYRDLAEALIVTGWVGSTPAGQTP